MPSSNTRNTGRSSARWELPAALGITAAGMLLHFIFVLSAGGLWRDEAGGVALATLPTLGEMWQELTHDSFPPLYVLLLRCWVGLGLGSDLGLRCLGGLIGLSWLGAVWCNARWFGIRAPWVCLSLLACNLALIRWGDSVRAYGLGCVMITLFVGRVWVFVRQPDLISFTVASLLGVLSVQSLYQCAFLVAATCLAASLVCLRRLLPRVGALALFLGLPAGLSLLPYVQPLRAAQSWWIVEKTGFNARWCWHTLNEALDTPAYLGLWVWLGLLLVASGYGLASLEKRVSRRDDCTKDLPLFGAISTIGGVVGFLIFVVNAGLPTQPWYWLLLLTYVAVCLEAILGSFLARSSRKIVFCAVLFSGICFVSSLIQIRQRFTNMPQVAAQIAAEVGPQDLVVVYPWYCGVSFNRYYHSPTPWTTVPELADHRFHRYDLLKNKLQQSEPVHDLFDRIGTVLNSGGTIWLVGALPVPEPGESAIPTLPPAPESPTGWYDEPYNHVWGRQLENFIRLRSRSATLVFGNSDDRYTRYERIPVWKISGAAAGVLSDRSSLK